MKLSWNRGGASESEEEMKEEDQNRGVVRLVLMELMKTNFDSSDKTKLGDSHLEEEEEQRESEYLDSGICFAI